MQPPHHYDHIGDHIGDASLVSLSQIFPMHYAYESIQTMSTGLSHKSALITGLSRQGGQDVLLSIDTALLMWPLMHQHYIIKWMTIAGILYWTML